MEEAKKEEPKNKKPDGGWEGQVKKGKQSKKGFGEKGGGGEEDNDNRKN